MLNTSKMAVVDDDDGTGVKSDARDPKHNADAMDSLGNWTDTLRGHRDAPCIQIGMYMSADATRFINT